MLRWIKTLTIGALILALACSAGLYLWLLPPASQSEIMFTGGNIITMEDELYVEAVLVKDGRIVAVGSENEVRAKVSEEMSVFDLEGQTLMPGLIEPHAHPWTTALLSETTDLSGFTHASRAEVIASLETAIAEADKNEWVIAFGWDPVMLDDLSSPTLEELDALAPDNPLLIVTQMMHDAYVNSKALELAGITAETSDPQGGEFVKDEQGRLTGTIREVPAIDVFMAATPSPPEGSGEFLLARQWARYARAGYTTVATLGIPSPDETVLERFRQTSRIDATPIRSVLYGLPKQLTDQSLPNHSTQQAAVIGVKLWIDGSPFAGGAAFAEPYENTPLVRERLHLDENHLAPLNHSDADLATLIAEFHERGYQIAVHTQGERAVEQVLNAADAVLKANPHEDHRWRLEHNALITKEQLERAQTLGLTPSFFVDHVYFYGHALPQLVGDKRTDRYMPLKTALDTGHKVTIHTDNPATPLDPFRAMRTARDRRARFGGEPVGANEAISPLEALRAMTIDAAWQLRLEEETGSLAPGKSADLVLLSTDPLKAGDEELAEIEVRATWLKGQRSETRDWNRTTVRLAWEILKSAF